MFVETRDEELFRQFWEDEAKLPRWFQDGANAFGCSWEDFKGFCDQCWRVYEYERGCLVYVEKLGLAGNVHFSILRKSELPGGDELLALRNTLLQSFELLFGFVGVHNRGLKRIIESVGFKYHGFRMYRGMSHGRVLEWRCYSVNRNEFFTYNKNDNLLTFI